MKAALELLQNADDPAPERFERPLGFHFDNEWKRFESLVREVERVLEFQCTHDGRISVQDASYLGEIFLPESLLKSPIQIDGRVEPDAKPTVMISNFARLAAIPFERFILEEVVKQLEIVLDRLGYVYVPVGLLFSPYTGTNPGVTGSQDWYGRFFDYS